MRSLPDSDRLARILSEGIDLSPKAIANYPESKFLDPFLSEIHEPERIKELAQLKERKVAAAIALEAAVARLDAAKSAKAAAAISAQPGDEQISD